METHVDAPQQAGSREQAQDLLSELPQDLSGTTVVLDCTDLLISTPSFLDEIVREVLVERGAGELALVAANERTRMHVSRAAENRGVGERLRVGLKI